MAFQDKTIREFALDIAAESPLAGGGCVSALAGAYGAALTGMVAQKTILNKKYADLAEQFQTVRAQSLLLCQELLEAIQRDNDAYREVKLALAMPKETQEQREKRHAAMQEGLKTAARAPMQVAETCVKLLPLCRETIEKGNTNAASDALVGALMLRSAILGAVYNVRINLQSVQDRAFCKGMLARADELQEIAETEERSLLALVPHLTEISDRDF